MSDDLKGSGEWPILGYGDSEGGCADCGADVVNAFVRQHPERGPVLVHVCLGDVHGLKGERTYHEPVVHLLPARPGSWGTAAQRGAGA